MAGQGARGSAGGTDAEGWDARRVRRLRRHLDATQGELAERLGTRQQTVSEWETGQSNPRRMSQRLLHFVAEESAFYAAEPALPGPPAAEAEPEPPPAADEQQP